MFGLRLTRCVTSVPTPAAAPIYLGHPMTKTLSVSVVEGMVLPVVDGTKPCDNGEAHIRDDGPGYLPMNRWVAMPARGVGEYVRLPSAAAPGMFAVLLDIHKGTT